MSATEITVIGNVVDSPRRVTTQGGKVTNFRLAATERRYDSATQDFTDGSTFWVDVECWGELGGHVSQSVSKGDPVVVVGRIRTHEWESETGRRSRPQIRAEAVGPNLARGVADFKRAPRAAAAQPADGPVDAHSAVPGEGGSLVAGRDYEVVSMALHEQEPDLDREPAHA